MKKPRNNKGISGALIRLLIINALLAAGFFAYFSDTFSWFITNKNVNGNGTMNSSDHAMAEVRTFRYIGDNVVELSGSEVELSMTPGESELFIILVKSTVNDPIYLTYALNEFQVCYYGLQYCNTDTQLDAFLEPYMRAGDYSYTESGTEKHVKYTDMTSDAYLSFVRPCSNAIKVNAEMLDISNSDASTYAEALAYAEGQVVEMAATPQTLYQTATDYAVSEASLLAAGENDYTALTGGTPCSYARHSMYDQAQMSAYYCSALIIRFTFDATVYPSADIEIASEQLSGVVCENSNPFMFQRLKFNISLSTEMQ